MPSNYDLHQQHLSRLLTDAADRCPNSIAVEDETGRHVTYAQLAQMADRISTRLSRWGVGRGDRVGLFLAKSIEAVAAIHGILRTGAVYVPVDSTAPALRGAGILSDAGVKAIVADASHSQQLVDAWPTDDVLPRMIEVGTTAALLDTSWTEMLNDDAPSPLESLKAAGDPAYILYTSGSTGRPKGVTLTHTNAFAFLDWCDVALKPTSEDRFASHAPFHFDLSVFDLFAACRHAATLVLISESLAKDPARLGRFVTEKQIDVWYSAPSILALMSVYGELEQSGRKAPRLVLFAGEVFPITSLRRLRNLWPSSTLWNLYGPTETNVCTAYQVPDQIPIDQTEASPIGRVCSSDEARIVDELGFEVPAGTVGELQITGPSVMFGYFGRDDLTNAAFDFDINNTRWYRTGDLVSDLGDGVFRFHGRRDRMVKKRGYRIELGEVESALYRYEGVDRAAVIAEVDEESSVAIAAFVSLKPDQKGSIIAMKRHCTMHLPHYMIPDSITFLPNLPTTSTDKVDYQVLKRMGKS
jgi:amino acid adenylation domain-containing protein